ncbi:MAG: methyl-accepting chemotaxis protein [Clostridiales bacterium]|nr:methyl-accepting chemotaxis protein [Clostridiales bacterium]
MKNMKVSKKLLLGFGIVAMLTLIVGVVGAYGMRTLDKSYGEETSNQEIALPCIAHVLEYLQMTRVDMRNAIIYTGDSSALGKIESSVKNDISKLEQYMQEYNNSISDNEAQGYYNSAKSEYDSAYKPMLEEIMDKSLKGTEQGELLAILNSTTPAIERMLAAFNSCLDSEVAEGEVLNAENSALATKLLLAVIVIAVVAVAAAVFLGLYISSIISKPLIPLTEFMKTAVTTGNLTLNPVDVEVISLYGMRKDEVGMLIKNSSDFIKRVTEVSKSLETVARGDLTASLKPLSSVDTIGVSLESMVAKLNDMFIEINASTAQVSTGAKQVADGSQSLAQGSTEQASSVEELAASLGDVSGKTNQNAEMAKEAANLSSSIKESAEKGSMQMDNMMKAVTEINDASQSISKVIKVIDDIAFQTNILALNAAVEAARAGQHGKGFAVVAEEVRNLAGKSAEAAKDTSGLIENSIEKANLGMSIATETAESLKEIVGGINRNAEIIAEIEILSKEQNEAITQINIGIDQVAQVVQQNSATAEESAAASEEMSGQSTLLTQLISQFKLKNGHGRSSGSNIAISPSSAPYAAPYAVPSHPMPIKEPAALEKSSYAAPAVDDFVDNFDFSNDKY